MCARGKDDVGGVRARVGRVGSRAAATAIRRLEACAMNVETLRVRVTDDGATSPAAGPSWIARVVGVLGIAGALTVAGCESGGWGRPPPSQRESPAPGGDLHK